MLQLIANLLLIALVLGYVAFIVFRPRGLMRPLTALSLSAVVLLVFLELGALLNGWSIWLVFQSPFGWLGFLGAVVLAIGLIRSGWRMRG
jgi:hypothetical protein